MPLSREQRTVLTDITQWLSAGDRPALTLGGYAGTGKTTVIAALRFLLAKQRPQWNVAFAAYTGKATQVMAKKLKKIPVDMSKDSISTLHALLYQPIADSSGQIAGWKRKDVVPYDLLIIDEASMVTSDIWRDVQRLGIPILAVGDHGQLPPIGDSFSLMKEPDLTLTEIHRQAAASPIIHVATVARTTGKIPIEKFGPGVEKIDRQRTDAQLMLEDFFQQYSPDMLFLVGFNTSRVAINHSIRQAKYRQSNEPEPGDTVICLRNNWQEGIFNGMTGMVRSVSPLRDADEIISYTMSIEDTDGGLLYDGLVNAKQFHSEAILDLSAQERKRTGELFDFGYALTVHKAQGSQARRVIVIEERSKHMDDETWQRWLYTAVTRAEEELWVFG